MGLQVFRQRIELSGVDLPIGTVKSDMPRFAYLCLGACPSGSRRLAGAGSIPRARIATLAGTSALAPCEQRGGSGCSRPTIAASSSSAAISTAAARPTFAGLFIESKI